MLVASDRVEGVCWQHSKRYKAKHDGKGGEEGYHDQVPLSLQSEKESKYNICALVATANKSDTIVCDDASFSSTRRDDMIFFSC